MAALVNAKNNVAHYPIYGQPYVIGFPLLDADGDPIAPSSPDSEISKDFDTRADCTNEMVQVASSDGTCYLILTATEMTANVVTLELKSTGAKTTCMTLYPRKLQTLRAGTSQGGSSTTVQLDASASAVDDFYNGCFISVIMDSAEPQIRIITDYVGATTTATVGATLDTLTPDSDDTFTIFVPEGATNVITINQAASDTATSIASATASELGTGSAFTTLATQASVNTIDDFIDTEVAAIKAKTDLIPGTQDGKTFAEVMLLLAAAILSKRSGMGTTTGVIRALDDSQDRITATIDSDGNRTAVTFDVTSP